MPGELTHERPVQRFGPWRREGVRITAKVLALVAGYAMFVWITMTQLEQRYLAPAKDSAGGQIDSRRHPDPVRSADIQPSSVITGQLGRLPQTDAATVKTF
jgi:hypothetical protein